MILTKKNYHQLVRGASIFATGGGLSYSEQIKSIKKLGNFTLEILPLLSFSADSQVIMVAEAGQSDAPPIKKKPIIQKMILLLQKMTQKKISGIYPFEIGQESITLESAHYLNLPIVDFDFTGCRSVPFFDINIFNLKNLPYSYSPLVICTDQLEIFVVPKLDTVERTEQIFREMVSFSKTGIVFFMGGITSVKTMLELSPRLMPYQKAFKLGKTKNIQELISNLGTKEAFEVIVKKRETLEKKGFLCQKISLISSDKREFLLSILNETIMLEEAKKTIAVVPERILMIHKKELRGISSSELIDGFHFILATLSPEKEWEGEKAKKLFGADRFSFFKTE